MKARTLTYALVAAGLTLAAPRLAAQEATPGTHGHGGEAAACGSDDGIRPVMRIARAMETGAPVPARAGGGPRVEEPPAPDFGDVTVPTEELDVPPLRPVAPPDPRHRVDERVDVHFFVLADVAGR